MKNTSYQCKWHWEYVFWRVIAKVLINTMQEVSFLFIRFYHICLQFSFKDNERLFLFWFRQGNTFIFVVLMYAFRTIYYPGSIKFRNDIWFHLTLAYRSIVQIYKPVVSRYIVTQIIIHMHSNYIYKNFQIFYIGSRRVIFAKF